MDAAYIALICALGLGLAGVGVELAAPAESRRAHASALPEAFATVSPRTSAATMFPSPGALDRQPSPDDAVSPTAGPAGTETRLAASTTSTRPLETSAEPRPRPTRRSATVPAQGSSPTTAVAAMPFCSYSYNVYFERGGDFGGTLVVVNASSSDWSGWRGSLSWSPAPRTVISWQGTFWGSDSSTTLIPAAHNSAVPSGESVVVGFHGWSATTGPPLVSGFSVQGHSCRRLAGSYGS